MKKNVASQRIGAQMVSASDGSAFTGSVTVYVTGDGGTQAIGSVGSGVCAHEGNGFHTYAPAQAETNYDHIGFTFIGSGAVPASVQVFTAFPQTGDNFTRLGAPVGASISADIAAVDTVVDAILVDTAVIGAAGAGLTAIPWNASWDAEVQSEAADALNAYDPPTKAELDSAVAPLATAAALATVDGIVDAILLDTGTDGVVIASGSLGALADAVWDEVLSGHLTGGTTGNALNAAGAAGDPWTTALPGAYSAGSAGYIVGTNLDATVSSRASQTSLDTVDGIVDAILVDTDTTIPGLLATIDGIVNSILVDTGTDLPALLVTIDGIVDSILLDTAVLPASYPANFASLAIDASGNVAADVQEINGDSVSADNLAKTTRAIARGTVTTGASTTSIPTSAFTPAGAVADQFKGRIVTFDADTTTTALRGQSTDITASSNSATPTLTVTALTTAPASGDTFSVT